MNATRTHYVPADEELSPELTEQLNRLTDAFILAKTPTISVGVGRDASGPRGRWIASMVHEDGSVDVIRIDGRITLPTIETVIEALRAVGSPTGWQS